MNTMAQRKSNVWNFFKICSDDERKADCILCETTSRKQIVRGKSRKLFSTKPLWNHLKSKHPLIMKTLDGEINVSENIKVEIDDYPISDSLSTTITSKSYDPLSTTITSKPCENFMSETCVFLQEKNSKSFLSCETQPTLQCIIKEEEMWSLDDSRSVNITKRIGEMIALDAEAFTLVERKGFERLIKYLAPQYPLPCRTYFSDKIIPQLHETLKTRICKKLATATYISFCTNIWTCSANNEAIISLTAHFIRSDDMERETYVLSVKHFPDSHAVNIDQILNDIMEEWHISSNQIHLILRDNASNMIIGSSLLGDNIGCVIHTLQLVIHDCIFKNQKFIEILRKCRKIVEHFNHSSLAYSKLSSIQKILKLPNHKLIYDDTTRWNSTFYMLSSLHEQRQAITAYAADRDIPTLTVMQWSIVENVLHVLQPFEEITKILSSDCETIGYVIPAVVILHSYLSKRQKDAGIVMLKEELKKAMEERFFISTGFKDRKCFVLATVLDPRFKTKFLSDENKVKQWIITELLEMNNTVIEDDENNMQNHDNPLQKQDISETQDDIWKCFDDIINNSKLDNDNNFEDSSSETFNRQSSDRTEKIAIYNAELTKYLTLPLSPRNEDPLIWWKTHVLEYPNLKTLVLKYLSAPPSSVHSERLFNVGKLVYSDNRNKLSPKNAEILLFIMKNLLILNFNY
ncbi:PREDICTED: zinc finger BED domain-containing protein 4-like [Trachymyrmex cornetzi]|nr:PREDICTED: zinc finger BED domain-containing protein 4-like [Trachymyrmex cornetzi]